MPAVPALGIAFGANEEEMGAQFADETWRLSERPLLRLWRLKADGQESTPRPTGTQHILRVKAAIRGSADGRPTSDFRPLCQQQSVLHVDTKISDRVLNLGVTEQDLDGADVASRLVDHGRLRATERVSAKFLLA